MQLGHVLETSICFQLSKAFCGSLFLSIGQTHLAARCGQSCVLPGLSSAHTALRAPLPLPTVPASSGAGRSAPTPVLMKSSPSWLCSVIHDMTFTLRSCLPGASPALPTALSCVPGSSTPPVGPYCAPTVCRPCARLSKHLVGLALRLGRDWGDTEKQRGLPMQTQTVQTAEGAGGSRPLA